MRIRTIGLLAASLAGLAIATPATAETTPSRKTLEQVVTELSAKGYAIREIEMDDGHFEATVIDPKNIVSEAKIDGYTGEILRLERKH
ncbi:PepSY domain-containing protein [Shinella sp. CPCC 101442]|uniref:PepSY domain-containing protein n=1 Tax=Shinella sp. CPCC 101442 TaxID=2932265 RepID=UPI002152B7F2|nr:PepSY domain-containing protein [Shinella sp. CPCC 101442]MCR6501186.1 PepSY domain-containing protein [Shinella sp. CPCC 101442]